MLRFFACLLVVLATACAGKATRLPEPPAVPQREPVRWAEAPAGETVVAGDAPTTFTLFLPAGWSVPPSCEATVSIHFHGTAWFVAQEHARRGSTLPFVSFNAGASSAGFENAFKDPATFDNMLDATAAQLVERGAPADTRIAHVELSSFSAGYAAVREILKSPRNVDRIDRLVLADSLYAPDDPAVAGTGERRPDPAALEPFVAYARLAADGKKTFLIAHSSVPPLGSITAWMNAETIARSVDPKLVPVAVEPGSLPATEAPDFPLVTRIDRRDFHVWRYGGENGGAHMTHLRHVGDYWIALDAAK